MLARQPEHTGLGAAATGCPVLCACLQSNPASRREKMVVVEHLVMERSQIRVPQTKDQTLKECEHKSCGFPISPAFLSDSREKKRF